MSPVPSRAVVDASVAVYRDIPLITADEVLVERMGGGATVVCFLGKLAG